ncbi:MAG: primosomal protein N' [Thermodesulfovibrio sp.]|nr:primosomal protein N' [Thermodesulfovibrio sp.]
MPYYDVSIPLRLKTLTYYYEENRDLAGFVVKVPLKNRIYDGIVLGKRESLPEGITQIKEIKEVIGKAYTEGFIEFLKWLSNYTFSEIGSVLRVTFFEEILKFLENKRVRSKKRERIEKKGLHSDLKVNDKTLSKIINSLGNYKAILIHCPNIYYEIVLMTEVIKRLKDEHTVILMFPEIKDANLAFSLLPDIYNERSVLLHSEMSTSEITSSVYRIMENRAKIVVGTRSAIFAPLKTLSLIMVAEEGSFPLKEEQTPKYNATEAAIMRAFIERCPVVLLTQMPSTTSYFNVLSNKYEFISDFDIIAHPQIRILRQPYKKVFHPDVLLAIKINYKEGILITVPRSGYSLIRCVDCGQTVKCDKCGYSMIFSKKGLSLECFRCGIQKKTFTECPYCKSININPIGTGIEKILEEIKSIFPSEDLLLREFDLTSEEIQGISIIQTAKIKKTFSPQFKYAVVVDFDFFLSLPDYRATEEAFRKVLLITQLVKQDGTIFIQTNNPENKILKFIRDYNFKDFYLQELRHRGQIGFPPFAKLVKVTVKTKKNVSAAIVDEIKRVLSNHIQEVLGPFKAPIDRTYIFILRFKNKKEFIKQTKEALTELESFQSISFSVEVDPVTLKI